MSVPALRPYQIDLIGRFDAAVAAGKRRILLQLSTGAGKTVVAAEITRSATAKQQRVLFLAHRRELIRQASEKLYAAGVQDHGIIQAGFPPRPAEPIQIASISTLHARAIRGTAMELPAADVVIIDEAHHAPAKTYRQIVAAYPDAVILGVTATPARGDGRGLGSSFDVLIEGPNVAALIGSGYLVPTKVYAPSRPDLSGVAVTRGDYVESQLAEVMNKKSLVGDVITNWHRLAEGRPTVVFASGVGHSVHLRDEFRTSGVLAEHIDGGTPIEERDAILVRLAKREIEVVCNAMVLTEGWDAPAVSALVLARPTKSLALYLQMVGRVLRPAPGKSDAIVLDHSGAVFAHGFVDDEIHWTLTPGGKVENKSQGRRGRGQLPRLTDCPECHAIRFEGRPCSCCGWRPQPKAKAPDVIDGDLAAVTRERKTIARIAEEADKRRWHAELSWIADERGYRPGWASHKFKEKFGNWPTARFVDPQPPSPEVRSWIKSRQIAYAKMLARERAA